MILVKIIPEAPTKAPAIINSLFPNIKPVVEPAKPEYEFKSEIATGISAPPIGRTSKTPSTKETIVIARVNVALPGFIITINPGA